MSWVRYDDGFDSNPKITAVIAENPAAIALHVLARTWTARQRYKGYIPQHQPGLLVCDKALGAEWAAVLLKYGCFHQRGRECAECRAQIAMAAWPTHSDGFAFHQWWVYDPPARDRVTPGTPGDLSEKRRAAGRAGGLRSAESRQRAKQTAQANQPNGVSKPFASGGNQNEAKVQANHDDPDFASGFASLTGTPDTASDLRIQANGVSKASNTSSNSVTPVPVPDTDASNEASGAAPWQPRNPRAPSNNAGDVIAAFVEGAVDAGMDRPPENIRKRVGADAKKLLNEGYTLERLVASARAMGATTYNDLSIQVRKDDPAAKNGHASANVRYTDEDYQSGWRGNDPISRRQQATDRLFDEAMERAKVRDARAARNIQVSDHPPATPQPGVGGWVGNLVSALTEGSDPPPPPGGTQPSPFVTPTA